jgi:predicted metalloprotease
VGLRVQELGERRMRVVLIRIMGMGAWLLIRMMNLARRKRKRKIDRGELRLGGIKGYRTT